MPASVREGSSTSGVEDLPSRCAALGRWDLMTRLAWIVSVLVLGLAIYGLALPHGDEIRDATGRDYWRAFFRQDRTLGSAVPKPHEGSYLVLKTPTCCRKGHLLRIPPDQVEAAIPAALRELAGEPPPTDDYSFVSGARSYDDAHYTGKGCAVIADAIVEGLLQDGKLPG